MRSLITACVVVAIITSGSLAFAQPPEEGDPAFGSVTSVSLTFTGGSPSSLNGSATFHAIVPSTETISYWFSSDFTVSGATMGVSGENELLAPGQSATWTLTNSQASPSSGLKTLDSMLAKAPAPNFDPDYASWIVVDDSKHASVTVP